MKKLLFTLLALPMFATAQEKSVRVPTCEAGSAFTIKIPVKFPDSMTVQYAWYRNDTLIDDTHMLLLGEKAIAYTIPADKAFGSAVYHFTYNLHDEHDGEWTDSPRYMVSFLTACPPIPGAIEDGCTGVAAAGAIEDSCTGITAAGAIEDTCTGITAAGAIEDTCTGVTSAGRI